MVAQRTAELEERGRELQSFSYAVSHDLRAPLRGISGWIEALEEDCPGQLDDTGRAHLGRIQLEVDRLGSLIEGLLRLARIGTTEIRRSRVDLSDMAKRVILRLRQTDPDRAGDVQVEEGMSAWGDPALLEIALTNLLENAWKFSAKAEHPSIQFRTAGLHSRDQFVVVDNGAGFDPSNHRRLFIPFQRFHRQSEFPGTGIGLTTVQRIIRRHGGEIEVESRLGRGTTVRFSIPAVADTPFQNPPRP
jgi:signal transduction histidine kinase